MSRKSVSKSKRQYTSGLNSPALRVVRDRKEAKGAPLPSFIEPWLAELRHKPPHTDDWVHEIKFDGYRLQLRVQGDRVNRYRLQRRTS